MNHIFTFYPIVILALYQCQDTRGDGDLVENHVAELQTKFDVFFRETIAEFKGLKAAVAQTSEELTEMKRESIYGSNDALQSLNKKLSADLNKLKKDLDQTKETLNSHTKSLANLSSQFAEMKKEEKERDEYRGIMTGK